MKLLKSYIFILLLEIFRLLCILINIIWECPIILRHVINSIKSKTNFIKSAINHIILFTSLIANVLILFLYLHIPNNKGKLNSYKFSIHKKIKNNIYDVVYRIRECLKYIIIFLISPFIYLIFARLIDIKNFPVDETIVINSLFSLILGNLFERNNECFNKSISFFLKYTSYGLFSWTILISFVLFKWLNYGEYNSTITIILISISVLLKILSSVILKSQNLFYATWWTFILILYLMKIS